MFEYGGTGPAVSGRRPVMPNLRCLNKLLQVLRPNAGHIKFDSSRTSFLQNLGYGITLSSYLKHIFSYRCRGGYRYKHTPFSCRPAT